PWCSSCCSAWSTSRTRPSPRSSAPSSATSRRCSIPSSFAISEAAMVSPGIDLFHHNPTPDWAKMKQGGAVGGMVLATEGTSYQDSTFAARKQAAQAAGLIVCSYHFLKHGSVSSQMRWYQQVANFQAGERAVIDFEDAAVTLSDLTSALQSLQTL